MSLHIPSQPDHYYRYTSSSRSTSPYRSYERYEQRTTTDSSDMMAPHPHTSSRSLFNNTTTTTTPHRDLSSSPSHASSSYHYHKSSHSYRGTSNSTKDQPELTQQRSIPFTTEHVTFPTPPSTAASHRDTSTTTRDNATMRDNTQRETTTTTTTTTTRSLNTDGGSGVAAHPSSPMLPTAIPVERTVRTGPPAIHMRDLDQQHRERDAATFSSPYLSVHSLTRPSTASSAASASQHHNYQRTTTTTTTTTSSSSSNANDLNNSSNLNLNDTMLLGVDPLGTTTTTSRSRGISNASQHSLHSQHSFNSRSGSPLHTSGNSATLGLALGQSMITPTEIQDMGEFFLIKLEAPGLTARDIHVRLLPDHMLKVSGEYFEEHMVDLPDGSGQHRTERNHRTFAKTFTLPENADIHNIQAYIEFGVVHVRINKLPDLRLPSTEIPIFTRH